MAKRVTVCMTDDEQELADRIKKLRSYNVMFREFLWEIGEKLGHAVNGRLVRDYSEGRKDE